MAYYQLEPFGEERADLRMARMTAMIVNALVGKDHYKEADLMFRFMAGEESLLDYYDPDAVETGFRENVLNR